MKKEELQKLGLTEEQMQEVFKLNGKDIEALKSENTKLTNEKEMLTTEKESLETQLGVANEKIEEFGKIDVEQIKKEAEDYKAKYEESKTEYESKINQMKLTHEIDMALAGAKVKNAKAVKALLDMEELETTKDFTKAMESQINTLKESDGYLFEGDKPTESAVGKVNTLDDSGDDGPLTYSQMMDKLSKNPGAKF